MVRRPAKVRRTPRLAWGHGRTHGFAPLSFEPHSDSLYCRSTVRGSFVPLRLCRSVGPSEVHFPFPRPSPPLSLSLSLTHTHTHTHTSLLYLSAKLLLYLCASALCLYLLCVCLLSVSYFIMDSCVLQHMRQHHRLPPNQVLPQASYIRMCQTEYYVMLFHNIYIDSLTSEPTADLIVTIILCYIYAVCGFTLCVDVL